MKTSAIIIGVAFAVFIGVVLGVIYANQNRMALDVASNSQRIASLEAERAERVAKKAVVGKAIGFGARALKMLSFGLIKLG